MFPVLLLREQFAAKVVALARRCRKFVRGHGESVLDLVHLPAERDECLVVLAHRRGGA